jgi:hypothetical protein
MPAAAHDGWPLAGLVYEDPREKADLARINDKKNGAWHQK